MSRSVAATLTDNPSLLDHLFICLPGAGCRFRNTSPGGNTATAAFSSISTNWKVVPFNTADKPPQNLQQLFSPEHLEGLKFYLQAIFLPPQGAKIYQEGNLVPLVLLHEIAHFSDYVLLSRWVSKNQKRLEQGQMPDPLFRSVVRILDGILEIDQPFVSSLLEAGGYQIMLEASPVMRPGYAWDPSNVSAKAYQQIVNEGGKPFLDRLQITPDNLFKKMEPLRAILER